MSIYDASSLKTVGDISDCDRCGGVHRGPLVFRKLTRPFAPREASGKVWTHYWTCTRSGEPVLLDTEDVQPCEHEQPPAHPEPEPSTP